MTARQAAAQVQRRRVHREHFDMGILDFLQQPDAQLGIGLLAAGGPSTTPMNFGQRLQGAMQGMDAQAQQALKMKLMQSQVDENASQAAMRKQQLAMSQRQMDMQNQLLGFGNPTGASPATSAAASGVMPTMPPVGGDAPTIPSGSGAPVAGMPSAPPQQGTLDAMSKQYGIPAEALKYDLVFNGGKGIAEMVAKRGTPNMQVVGNYAYDANKLQPGFLPSLNISQDGKSSLVQIGANGLPVVSAPEGAIDTATAYARAQAGLKPIKVYNPTTGREEYSNEAAVAGGGAARSGDPLTAAVRQTESNGNVNAVSPKGAMGDMQVMPGTNTSPGFGVPPARDGSQAERTRVGESYLKAMNDRYQNPTLAAIAYNWGPGNTDMWLKSGGDYNKLPPETQKYVSAVMTRTAVNGFGGGAPQSGNMAAGPSMQEKATGQFNDKMATEQGDILTKSYNSANDASSALAGIQESRKAMQSGAFQGTGAEAKLAIAKFGQSVGINIDPEKVANTDYLKSTLGNGLLEKAKTLGSNPSNADASRITDIVGSIGKDPAAMSKILDWQEEMARKAIDQHNTKVGQAESNGFKSQFDLRVKPPEQKTLDAPKVIDSLPKTAPVGKRMRNTETGKVMVFNGLQWKEE
jgi:hypothetical protein